jgi:hypothetical protein
MAISFADSRDIRSFQMSLVSCRKSRGSAASPAVHFPGRPSQCRSPGIGDFPRETARYAGDSSRHAQPNARKNGPGQGPDLLIAPFNADPDLPPFFVLRIAVIFVAQPATPPFLPKNPPRPICFTVALSRTAYRNAFVQRLRFFSSRSLSSSVRALIAGEEASIIQRMVCVPLRTFTLRGYSSASTAA